MSKSDNEAFSARQEQVLLLASRGLADKQIALELGLSIATIHTYWSRLRKKFGGGNRAELVTLAMSRNATETLTAKGPSGAPTRGKRAKAQGHYREHSASVFVKDLYGRYTMVNKVFQELVGREMESILGSRDHDLFGAKNAQKFQAQEQKVRETREPVVLDVTIDLPSGPRHFISAKFPLYDADDNVYAIGGFASDITDRAEFEKKIQASERRYRTLIENSTDVIMLIDRAGNIRYASPSARSLFAEAPEALEGTNAFRYIDRGDLARILKDFRSLTAEPGLSVESSYWILDTKGKRHFVEGRGTSVADDLGEIQVLLNFRDVTAGQLAERRLLAKGAVAKALAEAATPEEAYPVILQGLCESFSCQYATLWLVEDEALMPFVHHCGDYDRFADFHEQTMAMRMVRGDDLAGKAWQRAEAIILSGQNAQHARTSCAVKARFRTAVAFPIVSQQEVLGVIELFGPHIIPLDKEGLEVIGQQIAQFMKRKKAEAEELRLAQELSLAHADLRAANESLERRVRTRTIELEELNARLQLEIAERKRSEEDLLNMFHFSQSAVECSADGIVGFDRQCNITAWNKTMEDLTGVPKESVIGGNLLELFPFLTAIGEDEAFVRTLRGESSMSRAKPYQVPGQAESRLFDAWYRPVFNTEQEVIGGLATVREHQPSQRVSCL
jgi:PAS domain S-box-containing protein